MLSLIAASAGGAFADPQDAQVVTETVAASVSEELPDGVNNVAVTTVALTTITVWAMTSGSTLTPVTTLSISADDGVSFATTYSPHPINTSDTRIVYTPPDTLLANATVNGSVPTDGAGILTASDASATAALNGSVTGKVSGQAASDTKDAGAVEAYSAVGR